MRPRICMAVVSAKPAGTTFMNCRGKELEKHKRRAQFEINRKKLLSSVGSASIELHLFASSIANEIKKFKQSKKNSNEREHNSIINPFSNICGDSCSVKN